MLRESRKYLFDIHQACLLIYQFVGIRSYEEYEGDALLRSAVERQFEIIGEALNQLKQKDPELVSGIIEHQRIISFRNILIHGYAEVSNKLVWGIIESSLPGLSEKIAELLETV